jgi:hypothetical protein
MSCNAESILLKITQCNRIFKHTHAVIKEICINPEVNVNTGPFSFSETLINRKTYQDYFANACLSRNYHTEL